MAVRLTEVREERLTARTGLADYEEYNELYDAFIDSASTFHSPDLIPVERVAKNGVDMEYTVPAYCGRDDQDMSKKEVATREYYLARWKALDALMDEIAASPYVFRRHHHMLATTAKKRSRHEALDTDEVDHEYIKLHYKRLLLSTIITDDSEDKLFPR